MLQEEVLLLLLLVTTHGPIAYRKPWLPGSPRPLCRCARLRIQGHTKPVLFPAGRDAMRMHACKNMQPNVMQTLVLFRQRRV